MATFRTSKEKLDQFLETCARESIARNTDLISPGDPADTLYYIVSGSLVVMLEDEDGQELILAYLNAGEFLGEMGLFIDQSTRNVLIRTRTDTVLAEISHQRLAEFMRTADRETAINLLVAIGSQLSDRLLRTNRKAGLLAFYDVAGRIARTLLDLCEQPDAMTHPDGMQIQITRQELGRMVSCSREMAGRIMSALEEQGLITVEGKKTVVVHEARRPTYPAIKKPIR